MADERIIRFQIQTPFILLPLLTNRRHRVREGEKEKEVGQRKIWRKEGGRVWSRKVKTENEPLMILVVQWSQKATIICKEIMLHDSMLCYMLWYVAFRLLLIIQSERQKGQFMHETPWQSKATQLITSETQRFLKVHEHNTVISFEKDQSKWSKVTIFCMDWNLFSPSYTKGSCHPCNNNPVVTWM